MNALGCVSWLTDTTEQVNNGHLPESSHTFDFGTNAELAQNIHQYVTHTNVPASDGGEKGKKSGMLREECCANEYSRRSHMKTGVRNRQNWFGLPLELPRVPIPQIGGRHVTSEHNSRNHKLV